jgi:hypothetical protein
VIPSGDQWKSFVGRYEGGGQLAVQINQYYQAILSGMDIREVSLPAMEIAQQPSG